MSDADAGPLRCAKSSRLIRVQLPRAGLGERPFDIGLGEWGAPAIALATRLTLAADGAALPGPWGEATRERPAIRAARQHDGRAASLPRLRKQPSHGTPRSARERRDAARASRGVPREDPPALSRARTASALQTEPWWTKDASEEPCVAGRRRSCAQRPGPASPEVENPRSFLFLPPAPVERPPRSLILIRLRGTSPIAPFRVPDPGRR